jgi:hypothetical protein
MVELPVGSWWSWEIVSFDGSSLTLAAGADLTYHHELELSFVDVAYLSVPTVFEHPVFREPADDEIGRVHAYVGEVPPVVVAFDVEANAGGVEYLPCMIAADAFGLESGSFRRRQIRSRR